MYLLAHGNSVQKFPYSLFELRKEYPHISFPKEMSEEALSKLNIFPVTVEPSPAYDDLGALTYDERTEALVQKGPELINNQWVITWEVATATQDEIARRDQDKAEKVRIERNRRLADSDWTQLPDSPVDRTAWEIYRQSLRDLPAQEGFPWTVTWPEEPTT